MDLLLSIGLLGYVVFHTFPRKRTKYFDIYEKMKEDGLSEQSLKEFTAMEDLMLEYQRDALWNKIDRSKEINQLSNQIKKRFAAYDFD